MLPYNLKRHSGILDQQARWLKYDDVRMQADPKDALLNFLESAYRAGATAAHWDTEAFTTVSFA